MVELLEVEHIFKSFMKNCYSRKECILCMDSEEALLVLMKIKLFMEVNDDY